ncbi:MAG TPA: hypothetical protein VHV83_21770 [Armatimonadota bacterium]|nr:hypothetical protein [Armatimonadota bacterium]
MLGEFFQTFTRYAVDWVFWAVSIGAALGVWWLTSYAFAHLYFGSNSNQPQPAARSGIITGVIFTVVGITTVTWFVWHDLNRTIYGFAFALLAVMTVTLTIFSLDRGE